MVSTVKIDHTRSHDSTKGLVGRSSEKGMMTDAFLYMIGWGAGPCYVILQEEGFLLMNKSSGRLMLKLQVNTHIAGIRKESLFMTTLIGLGGVQRV